MARSKDGYYSWPKRKDVGKANIDFILCNNIHFVGAGKEGGGFIVSEEDLAELFDQYKHDHM